MAGKRELLGDYLLDKGIITESQLKEALDEHKRTHRRIGEILINRGFVTEEDIAKALSEQLDFPFVDLSTYQIEAETVSIIPVNIAKKLGVIAIFKVGDSLSVAMTNPLDVGAIDELTRITDNLRIKPLIATKTAIMDAISQFYGDGAAAEGSETEDTAAEEVPEEETTALAEEASQAPVIKLVNKLIEDAVKAGASDIHLEPFEKKLYCRLRIDGILHDMAPLPEKLQRAIISRVKIMSNMNIAQSRLPQDGRIRTVISEREIDLRVATLPGIHGEHIAIRILDKSGGIANLTELGFAEETLESFREIIHKPHGMILVTGPTGSGKSTTLYAALNAINDLKKNIVTLEDPVEYTIQRVNQSQVDNKTGLTFGVGLRSIVRLDPDVIMVGEIRDKETAEVSVRSALTGHLVFSSLHTNDAPSAAARLIDIGVEPYLVASSLAGILAQRLIRCLCPKCRKEYKPVGDELSMIDKTVSSGGKQGVFYEAVGCKECRDTGYAGRTSIFELLIPDNNIKELIVKKAPAHELKEAAVKTGMKTLIQSGIEKAGQGITSLSEVLRVTEDV